MAIIKSVKGKAPRWGARCYFSENAALVGDIVMGDDCSIWFGAVLRADVDRIVLGSRVNVQDGASVHQSYGSPTIIEDDVSLGHGAIAHGCTLRRGCLIGMNATVLDGADVGEGAIVAAGAVVLANTRIGAHELWGGTPAKFIKHCDNVQAEEYARHYMVIKEWYQEDE